MNASLTTQLFALLSTQINATRTGLGLPALSDGGIVFGHEVIPTRSSPPRITADLKDIRTETARHFGASLTSDGILATTLPPCGGGNGSTSSSIFGAIRTSPEWTAVRTSTRVRAHARGRIRAFDCRRGDTNTRFLRRILCSRQT